MIPGITVARRTSAGIMSKTADRTKIRPGNELSNDFKCIRKNVFVLCWADVKGYTGRMAAISHAVLTFQVFSDLLTKVQFLQKIHLCCSSACFAHRLFEYVYVKFNNPHPLPSIVFNNIHMTLRWTFHRSACF